MATISTIRSEQPYRITAGLSAAPSTTPTDYTLSREDDGACSIDVTLAWVPTGQPNVAELALSAPLLEGVTYVLSVAGAGSATVRYQAPSTVTPLGTDVDDPEAEAYGVDLAWLSGGLDARNDIPRRRGIACVRHDLAAAAVIAPGELFHMPGEGAGIPLAVNGPGTSGEKSRIGGALRKQWSRDRRVVQGGVSVSVDIGSDGTVSARGDIKTKAVDRPVQVFVPTAGPKILGA